MKVKPGKRMIRLYIKVISTYVDIARDRYYISYGLIPHHVIFFALERCVPQHWISFIKNYYVGIYSKSFSEHAPSNWHKHMRGIFAGCTLSIILFLAGINIILEYTLLSSAPCFINSSKVSLPLMRAFMDDINLMSSSVSGSQNLLSRCATALEWAGMTFRTHKSQYCHSQGKVIELYPFLCEETIRSNRLFFLHPFYSLSASEILRPYYRWLHL